MEAENIKHVSAENPGKDTSTRPVTTTLDAVDHSECSQLRRDKRYRAGALRTALVTGMEVVKEHAYWRNPELKSRVDATQPSVVEAGAAISA